MKLSNKDLTVVILVNTCETNVVIVRIVVNLKNYCHLQQAHNLKTGTFNIT